MAAARPAPTATAQRVIATPVGPLLLVAGDAGLQRLWFLDDGDAPSTDATAEAAPGALAVLDAVEAQLGEYFAGDRTTFDVDLDLHGTPFQQQVWARLQAIPYGATATYGALATDLGSPGASRAVGMANNKNPVAIIVPCHRVVGASGDLTGYAGGLDRKRFLLDLEAGVGALL